MSRAFVKDDDDRPEPVIVRRVSTERPPDPPADARVAGFGSTVTVSDSGGKTLRMRIVAEEEADPVRGAVAWTSPFAEALMGHKAGDRVIVARPAGPAEFLVESVER